MTRRIENTPVNHQYERELNVYGGIYSIDGLRMNFLDSGFADAQRELLPRFSTYWWDDRDKFVDFFGADVDPIEHGSYQARTVAIPLVNAQLDSGSTLFANGVADHFIAHHVQHDDHEGLHARMTSSTHDVPYREKTAQNDETELELWLQIHKELYGSSTQVEEHFNFVRLFESKSGSVLSSAWDISERIGYLHTGLRAALLAFEHDGLTDQERTMARWMAKRVVGRHFPVVEKASSWIMDAGRVTLISQTAVRQICKSYDISREELFNSEAA